MPREKRSVFKMPRERRDRSVSFERSIASPFRCSPNHATEAEEYGEEWEEVRCPICLEHPHNAVLLICSSEGCRPYLCDTSYRHTKCLDQFYTLSEETQAQKRMCPMCRGQISGWTIVDPCRQILDAKPRECSNETCHVSGTYQDLRDHARAEHSFVRPWAADPNQQHAWRRLEAIEGVISPVLDSHVFPTTEEYWLHIFFLLRVFSPQTSQVSRSLPNSAESSVSWRSTSLWGENYDNGWRRRTRRRTAPDNQE